MTHLWPVIGIALAAVLSVPLASSCTGIHDHGLKAQRADVSRNGTVVATGGIVAAVQVVAWFPSVPWFWLAMVSVSMAIAVVDEREYRIPDALVVTGVFITVAHVGWHGGEYTMSLVAVTVGGGALAFGLVFFLAMLRPGAMGFGDVKLAGMIGAAVGQLGHSAVLSALVVASIVGGARAVLSARRVGDKHVPVPMGASMVAGMHITAASLGTAS